ncbi:unnamed protein product [Bemisia tabaci]|uniref:CHCH domain-containing protein n=1 Tax=Bemisia tabaci TaxID=7038 RepID=A0A9P0AHS8_BEMTA|nr:unnamed protein product [Bemisia tabaci]
MVLQCRSYSRLYTRCESKVKYTPLAKHPLKLANRVGSGGKGPSQAYCLQEMFNMFSCLKKNEFSQSPCSNEITTFQTCAEKHKAELKKLKEDERAGILTPGTTKLSANQVNLLLKRFPN